jgi:hypothetical protein
MRAVSKFNMNLSLRSLSRPLRLRNSQLALRPALSINSRPSCRFREVATSVSGKPASQTLEHAALNVKEEVGNSAADLAKSIAGGYLTQPSPAPAGRSESFVRLPKLRKPKQN